MPQVFKMGPYLVYFWSNENEPLETVHVPWFVARGSWLVVRGSWFGECRVPVS